MRYVDVRHITAMVSDMCIEANCKLPPDIKKAIKAAYSAEDWPTAKEILEKLLQNAEIAARERMPLCQDTGMTCVFVDVGQEVCFTGGYLGDAINEGVRQGYEKGCLRKSIVGDPLEKRENTGDNTPALIYYNIVPGDKLRITVAPKGFGSENMSRTAMLTPAHGISGVKDFVINTVKEGGPNPCPGCGGGRDRRYF